jgi:hypothetical protein
MNSHSEIVSGVFGQKKQPAERVNSLFLTRCGLSVLLLLGFWVAGIGDARAAIDCHRKRTVTADVVAIDQPLMFNRLGAQNINGMVFALKRDVVDDSNPPKSLTRGGSSSPGHVFLRPDKRPRPLVLRVAAGDCLNVTLTNLLTPIANPRGGVLTPPAIPSGVVPPPPNDLPPPQTTVSNTLVPSFNNFPLDPVTNQPRVLDDQVKDRMVSFHVQGMQLVTGIADDASMVGSNPSSLVPQVAPGNSKTYHLYAEKEGAFLVTSHGATFGSDSTSGNSTNGLFGAVNVEPAGARLYRSQVTDEEIRLATTGVTATGQPIINYEALYPAKNSDGTDSVWAAEGKAGLPVLNMLSPIGCTTTCELVHSDINGIISGPDADGTWTSRCPDPDGSKKCPYPLESVGKNNPSLPNRLEAFREFTVIFHDEMAKTNAFEHFYDRTPAAKNPLGHTLKAVGDVFMINYGSGGIGSEIIANRLGVGPMHDCLGCNAEEFFLTSHAVGDPAMVVDIPANFGLENCKPHANEAGGPTLYTDDGTETGPTTLCAATGPKATRAYYPDDPSNVHHSYISDHVKFRNLHTGKEHHIFHLHNHQWLYNPNDDNANYLDAQAIGPGAGYTYEINFGGSGNRNKSAGDAIFHCHLYPHFAQGMWELWRNHDVFESGSPLQVSGSATGFHTMAFALQDGLPLQDPADPAHLQDPTKPPRRFRALPDGEIRGGTPIPGLIPLPAKAMAPMPGKVYVVENPHQVPQKDPTNPTTVIQNVAVGSLAKVDRDDKDGLLVNNTKTPLGKEINPTGLKNPGFPFWIAGVENSVGQRPPTPPLDMTPDLEGNFSNGGWDGGLPRHTLDGTSVAIEAAGSKEAALIHNETRFDLSKATKVAKPIWFPEDGTDLEKAAMAFHAVREHPSTAVTLDGKVIDNMPFVTNGSGRPVAGAPFHEPCMDDNGKVLNRYVDKKKTKELTVAEKLGAFLDGRGGKTVTGSSPFTADNPRVYKGADIQFDAVLNKAGWHYPQERIIALWQDAVPTISKAKAPEPLVMRNNTFDCTMYLHTNLVPEIFEMDDFEVRTSTDIIGQHIHLPKWDLSTTDGSGNGWNYEDGTLAPDAVHERIEAINQYNKLQLAKLQPAATTDVEGQAVYTSANIVSKAAAITAELTPLSHPYFGNGSEVGQNWLGARTTLQRWFFDPVVNAEGIHRGLGIIFTHDHFGPSTHQQVGLYATVLVEPAGSAWVHNENGVQLGDRKNIGDGGRSDGGPTSWQAAILTGANKEYTVGGSPGTLEDLDGDKENDSYREFYLEYSDFQHAYLPGTYVGASQEGIPKYGKKPDEDGKGHFKKPEQSSDTESYKSAINPPVKDSTMNLRDLVIYKDTCPLGFKRPCPEAITADDPGTMVVNYRNEPIGLRILDTKTGEQAEGKAGDLAYALQTFKKHWYKSAKPSHWPFSWFSNNQSDDNMRAYRVANATFGTRDGSRNQAGEEIRGVLDAQPREGDSINGTCFPRVLQAKCWTNLVGPKSGLPKCGADDINDISDAECLQWHPGTDSSAKSVARPGDPFTPIMRAYYGDRVRIKVQAGGDEETHNVTLHGVKWLQGGSGFGYDPNSGWRNSQQGGISEQFTFAAPMLPLLNITDKNQFSDPKIKRIINEFNPGFEEFLNETSQVKELINNVRLPGVFKEGRERLEQHFDNFKKARGQFPLREANFEEDFEKESRLDELDVQLHQKTDHLYSVDASTEGYWNGTWGIIRTYDKGIVRRGDLVTLPNNDLHKIGKPDFDPAVKDVCPTDADHNPIVDRHFDISAVLANDVLGNNLGKDKDGKDIKATIPVAPDIWSGSLNKEGGTLVYNPRSTDIRDVTIPANAADGTPAVFIQGHKKGVLHDPTAMLYVHTRDLQSKDPHDPACSKGGELDRDRLGKGCPAENIMLRPEAPVEPLVLRARAGECIEVTLRNLIGKKGAADVLTYRQLAPVIPRNPDNPDGTVLNSNRVRTTSIVGFHPALVAYDVTTNDGTVVGLNDNSKTLADTENQNVVKYRWYAGDISLTPDRGNGYGIVRTPIEFGGINLMPADKIKQGQKGLVGALVIEPAGSTWNDESCDRNPTAPCSSNLEQVIDHQQETVPNKPRYTRLMTEIKPAKAGEGAFRDFVTVVQKGLTQLYGDGKPVEGLAAVDPLDAEPGPNNKPVPGEAVTEDTEDAGAIAINYGSDPLWFRYGLPPNLPLNGPLDPNDLTKITSFRNVPNAHEAYSNKLAGNVDPAVPVLTVKSGKQFRMHVLEPAGTARGSVFNLHGHVWQRAPYLCLEDSYLGIPDFCPKTGNYPTQPGFKVASRDIGINPLSIYMGGQDSILPATHFDIVLPKSGGENAIPGDYLYRDHAGFGNLGGLWGIVRVAK